MLIALFVNVITLSFNVQFEINASSRNQQQNGVNICNAKAFTHNTHVVSAVSIHFYIVKC